MEQAAVQIGSVLAGRYRIDKILGQGGMGIVVQAMHLQLHQPVAIKFLLPEVLGNPQIVQRFLREAQAAVRLRSEHVARVIDVGTLETGAPYMVLEYLDGADLSNYPRAQLTIGGIVDFLLQACEALAEAHSLGIVHRDIKPANFFITRRADGTSLLKVLDFGISKIQTTDHQLTATQAVMGTPAYMSPEQMRSSRDVDHRSDIWALGVVLYELMQGAPPFGGDTFSSMVLKIVTEPLPRLAISLPGDLDSIIYRCLEKDPARRFQNVAELAHALARYASSPTQAAISIQRTSGITGTSHPPVALDAQGRRAGTSTISGAVGAMTTPPSADRRRWPIVAVLGVLAAVVAVAIIGSRGEASRSGAQPASPVSTPGPAAAPVAPPPTAPPPVAETAVTTTPEGTSAEAEPSTAAKAKTGKRLSRSPSSPSSPSSSYPSSRTKDRAAKPPVPAEADADLLDTRN